MIYLYIFGSIALLIAFIIIMRFRYVRKKHERFLNWISTWKVDDVVEIKYGNDEFYHCVEDNQKHTASAYRKKASQAFKSKHGVENPYAKLKKWDDENCLVEMADGETYHMATSFININITATKRKIDRGMDNFATEKQKMRFKKLGRLLDNAKDEKDGQ